MSRETLSNPTPKLDRLNAAERDVLELLAQGHTAKSIAGLRNLSVAAVNERLRAARRKTGIGSSREIARLLAAQERRDDLIGLASPISPPAPSINHRASSRRAASSQNWRLPMSLAAILVAAVIGLQTVSPPALEPQPSSSADHPAVKQLAVPPRPTMQERHQEVMSGRDPEWSAQAETTLMSLYRDLKGGADLDVRVRCGRNLCEIAGSTIDGLTEDQAFASLGVLPSVSGVRGLHHEGYSIGSGPNRNYVFLAYWRRMD